MPLVRLCTAVLISAFALHAAAQSIPSSPKTATITMGYPQTFPAPPETPTQRHFFQTSPRPLFGQSLGSNTNKLIPADPTLTARLHAPCSTLRMYGFAARDLKSYSPHASTYTTCSPAVASDLKEIQARPAPVKAVNVGPPAR